LNALRDLGVVERAGQGSWFVVDQAGRRAAHAPAALAALSPYITERINRFGEYATDGLTNPPDAFQG
jgi:hypothetical protein